MIEHLYEECQLVRHRLALRQVEDGSYCVSLKCCNCSKPLHQPTLHKTFLNQGVVPIIFTQPLAVVVKCYPSFLLKTCEQLDSVPITLGS